MIAVVTDSSSQLSPRRARRAGITVVPLTVLLGDEVRLEGVDLEADEFYHDLDARATATTSLPSPGRFAALYDELLESGADEIVSVHVSESVSGTVGAARLAAHGSPVHVIDSTQASFGLGVCALAVAAAVSPRGSVDDGVRAVEDLAPHIGNAFVVGSGAGGRVEGGRRGAGARILAFERGVTKVLADVPRQATVAALAAAASAAGAPMRVAVGASDRSSFGPADELSSVLGARSDVVAVERYRIGPSVGAHTGPGTYGVFWWPAAAIREAA